MRELLAKGEKIKKRLIVIGSDTSAGAASSASLQKPTELTSPSPLLSASGLYDWNSVFTTIQQDVAQYQADHATTNNTTKNNTDTTSSSTLLSLSPVPEGHNSDPFPPISLDEERQKITIACQSHRDNTIQHAIKQLQREALQQEEQYEHILSQERDLIVSLSEQEGKDKADRLKLLSDEVAELVVKKEALDKQFRLLSHQYDTRVSKSKGSATADAGPESELERIRRQIGELTGQRDELHLKCNSLQADPTNISNSSTSSTSTDPRPNVGEVEKEGVREEIKKTKESHSEAIKEEQRKHHEYLHELDIEVGEVILQHVYIVLFTNMYTHVVHTLLLLYICYNSDPFLYTYLYTHTHA